MTNNHSSRIGTAVALSVALGAAGCGPRTQAPSGFQGIIEYEERVLGFELGGRVERLDVHRGDVVADGKVLATIDASLESLSRTTSADNTESARADLVLLQAGSRSEDVASVAAQVRGAVASETLATKAAERTRALVASGSISQAELDRAVADLDRAAAERRSLEQRLALLKHGSRPEEITRARARLGAASSQLALEDQRLLRYTLKAIGPGQVLDTHVLPGELAAAGAPVVTLADTSRPYIEVFVPQAELTGIQPGLKATVRIDAEPSSIPGTVEHLAARTEFTPRYLFSERERPNLVVRIRVRLDDSERKAHAGVPAFVTFAR